MKNQQGITFIEILIVITLIAIAVVTIFPSLLKNESKEISTEPASSGVAQERCIDGKKFIVDSKGMTTQMFDNNGVAILCE